MGVRERPQRNHSHAQKANAAIATNRRIHSIGAAALAWIRWPAPDDREGPAGDGGR